MNHFTAFEANTQGCWHKVISDLRHNALWILRSSSRFHSNTSVCSNCWGTATYEFLVWTKIILCAIIRCYRTRYPAICGRILQAHFDSHTETHTQVTWFAQHNTTLQLWMIDCGKLVERTVLPRVAETATLTQQPRNYDRTQNIRFSASFSRTSRSKHTYPPSRSVFLHVCLNT